MASSRPASEPRESGDTPDQASSNSSDKVALSAKIALAVVLVAELMNVLDHSIVLNAIPTLQRSLGAEPAHVQWFTAGYGLAVALGLITSGRLGDIYGRRRFFLIGATVFTLASLLCGIAISPEQLVLFRVLQGTGAAIMLPQVLATIHVTFEGEHRSRAFGLYGAILSLGSALGPVLGGVLVQADLLGLGWRPIFLINLPVGLAVIVLGRRFITESIAERAERFDVAGMLLSALAVLLLVLPLTEGPVYDWPAWAFAMLVGAVLVLGVFIAQQRRRQHDSPLVVLSIFRGRAFPGGLCAQLLFGLLSGMFFITWTLYLQRGLDMSPIEAAMAFVLITLGEMAGVAVAVRTAGRFARRLPQAGALLGLGTVVAYALLIGTRQEDLTLWEMAVPVLLFGVAAGMIAGPLADLSLSKIPEENSGSASGLFSTSIHLGMALGTALTALVFFSVTGGSFDGSANREAFIGVLWWVAGAFALIWGLLFFLPSCAKAEAD
ncbi:MFS transporter [Nocardiopsis alba]|uniref:MFS transporter n=1 Tax=Nocardiopsis alba TaxID=53437 RepID=UPI0005A01872|nr:MFS transporter [Nocardiopsis alba]